MTRLPRPGSTITRLNVHAVPDIPTQGVVTWQTETGETGEVPCALGRSGIVEDKQEGDGTTPTGSFLFCEAFWRDDRLPKLQARLPIRAIDPLDGWSDDPADPEYNGFVRHPAVGQRTLSAEHLWREDVLYNLILVIDHNQNPAIPGKGSAVFVHVAKPGYPPTEGCIALKQDHLAALCAGITTKTQLVITGNGGSPV